MPFLNKFGCYPPCECGLVVQQCTFGMVHYVPIPLKKVAVQAKVVDFVADVELVQSYCNIEANPVEAVYLFPLDEAAALVGFEATLDGRLIRGSVKEIEAAKKEYDNAVHAGQTSFLVTENKPDMFKIKIGMLKRGASAVVKLHYLTELAVDSKAVRFYIPTTISPRYIPDSNASKDEAKAIRNMTFSNTSPAPISITVEMNMKSIITAVESPSHAVNVLLNGKYGTATLAGQSADMDRDFVLLVHTENPHQPRLSIEHIADSVAASISFVPEFSEKIRQKVELIFLLDRSGSMGGQSIALAKKALKIFLHSLPVDSYFNVVGFGSVTEFLFPASVLYSEETFSIAIKHLEELDANLGGTEIYNPLKTILTHASIEEYVRQILVLTDGQVANTNEVIDLVQQHSNKARVFALGIGDSASHYLVEGMARAGHGTADFATYNEILEPKVQKQLSHCLQPALTNVEIAWDGDNMEYVKSIYAPCNVPPIFNRFRLLSYCIWDGRCMPRKVTIRACNANDETVTYSVHHQDSDVFQGDLIHKLAARKLIHQLEEGRSNIHTAELSEELVKKQIVDVALKYGLSSKYTAFVAVDEKSGGSEVWGMQTRQVPTQISHGWGGLSTVGSMSGGYQASLFSGAPAHRYQQQQQMQTAFSFGTGTGSSTYCSSIPQAFSLGQNSLFGSSSASTGFSFGACTQAATVSNTQQAFGPAQNSVFDASASSTELFSSTVPASDGILQPQQEAFSFGSSSASTGLSFGGCTQAVTVSNSQQACRPAQNSVFGAAATSTALFSSAVPASGGIPHRQQGTFGFVSSTASTGACFGSSPAPACGGYQLQKAFSQPAKQLSFGAPASTSIFGNYQFQQTSNLQQQQSQLEKLLEFQKFNGSFAVEPRLANIFGVTWDNMLAECGSLSHNIWITALAIKFLELVLTKEKDTWELIAEKSRHWLEQMLPDSITAESVLAQAELFIKKSCNIKS